MQEFPVFEPRTVTPEVAGSSHVSHCEPNRVNPRTFLALARLRLRHREPLEVGARQKNGDQSLALERVHAALLLRPCRRVQPCVAAFEELAAGTAYTPFPAGSLTAVPAELARGPAPSGRARGSDARHRFAASCVQVPTIDLRSSSAKGKGIAGKTKSGFKAEGRHAA